MVEEAGFSRYPVYRERIDEVVGIFYVKDALRLLQADADKLAATPVSAMLREVRFVPETTGAAKLLRRFQGANQHMAIVIDEYGTTVGLVTVEDVLEAIVGDIGDEYDVDEGEGIRKEGERIFTVPALTRIEEFNLAFGTRFSDEEYDTIGGLVLHELGRMPRRGEAIEIGGLELKVLKADRRRIEALRVTTPRDLDLPPPESG